MIRKKRESRGEGGREKESGRRRIGGISRRDGGREHQDTLRQGLCGPGSRVRLSLGAITSLTFLFPLQTGGFPGAFHCRR